MDETDNENDTISTLSSTMSDASQYDTIKENLLQSNTLYIDQEFQANIGEIFGELLQNEALEGGIDLDRVELLRAKEIIDHAVFIAHKNSVAIRDGIVQGNIGDCWWESALNNLVSFRKKFELVVPTGQSMTKSYMGMFRFCFWMPTDCFKEILVDDYLPCWNGRLLFSSSQNPREFWSALAEKALAKMCGNYSMLDGGFVNEASQILTGGICFYRDLSGDPVALIQEIEHALNKKAFVGISIVEPDNDDDKEELEHCGLIHTHAYSVHKISIVTCKTAETGGRYKIKKILLHIKNPHSEGEGYQGPDNWSCGAPNWDTIPVTEKERILGLCRDNGESVIEYKHLKKYFTLFEACFTHYPVACGDGIHKVGHSTFQKLSLECKWSLDSNGGCDKNAPNFCKNPKLVFEIDSSSKEVTIALLQRDYRRMPEGEENAIGLKVFKMADKAQNLNATFFRKNLVVFSADELPLNENSMQFVADRGVYCIVATHSGPNGELTEGEGLLRAFVNMKLLKEAKPNFSYFEKYCNAEGMVADGNGAPLSTTITRMNSVRRSLYVQKVMDRMV